MDVQIYSLTLAGCKRLVTFSLPGSYECLRSYKLLQVALVFLRAIYRMCANDCFAHGKDTLTFAVLKLFKETWKSIQIFLLFLYTRMTQVIEIIPRARQGRSSLTQPIPWLLLSGLSNEPGHRRPCYWSSLPGIFEFHHHVGYDGVVWEW